MREHYDMRTRKRILIHAGKDATNKAFAFFDNDQVVISDSTGKNGIMVTDEFGTGIQGPLTLLMTPEQIRVSAFWKVNPLVLSGLPSTVYTPIPWLKLSPTSSSKELVKGIDAVSALIA